jgi:SAM-dependent methyltransferase
MPALSQSEAIADWIASLQCIATDAAGIRCTGGMSLGPPSAEVTCDRCDARYPLVEGIPVLRVSTDAALLHTLDNRVYRNKSRHDSLAGKDLYLDQSRPMIDYLAQLEARGLLRGPALEIGCGLGIFADRVPGFHGLDYSLAALLADGFQGYRRVCASGDMLPFRDGYFATVFSLNTLEHVPELDRCLREIDRVLMPGGMAILKPAWNCMQYNCDGVGYLPYRELSWRNRCLKAVLPVLRSKAYKALTRVPTRAIRQFTAARDPHLRWKRLRPRFDLLYKVTDAEAFAQVDPCECIRWFIARGYTCLSHSSIIRRLCAGHDFVCLVKP